MSDMYTWLNIMENGNRVPFKEGESVQLSKRVGGGVGQYAGFSPERGTVTIKIKGAPQEFQLDDIEASIDPSASYYQGNSEEQRYGEVDGDQHYIPDRPELEAGQMVRIDNIYGQGNGEGYGVFVAYALDGQSAICNVDSENKTIPIEYIEAAPEESEDCFCDTGNDGALSPMSFGDEQRINIEDGKEDVTMEDLEKWMQVVEAEGEVDEGCDDAEDLDEGKEEDCDCGSYDCNTCFPEDKDVNEEIIDENEIYDIVYELAENDEFEDDLEEALDDDEEEIEEMRINEFEQRVREEGPEDDDNNIKSFLLKHIEQEFPRMEHDAIGAKGKMLIKKALISAIRSTGSGNYYEIYNNIRGNERFAVEKAREWFISNFRDEIEDDRANANHPRAVERNKVREEEDEFDTGDSSAEFASDQDAMVDIGDEPTIGADPTAGLDKEMGTAEVGGPSEDVSELIAKIAYVQDMGMSMTDRFYDPEKLTMMKPEMIQRIHSKVVGMEESASGGASGAGGVASGPMDEGWNDRDPEAYDRVQSELGSDERYDSSPGPSDGQVADMERQAQSSAEEYALEDWYQEGAFIDDIADYFSDKFNVRFDDPDLEFTKADWNVIDKLQAAGKIEFDNDYADEGPGSVTTIANADQWLAHLPTIKELVQKLESHLSRNDESTEEDNVGRARADKETRQAAADDLGDFDPNEFEFGESLDNDEDELEESGKPWEDDEDKEDDEKDDVDESWESRYARIVAESEDEEEDEVTEEKDEEDDSDEKDKIEESVAPNGKEAVSEAVDADVARAMKALFE